MKYFQLYASCTPVKGSKRSTICDLERRDYHYIPNMLFTLLTEYKSMTLSEIKTTFGSENYEVIDDYYDFLIQYELGFFSETAAESWPDIQENWESPWKLSNAILDIDNYSDYDLADLVKQLTEIGCYEIQLRIFGENVTGYPILEVLRVIQNSPIRALSIIAPYNYGSKYIDDLVNEPRVHRIMFFNAKDNRSESLSNGRLRLQLSTSNEVSPEYCGDCSADFFVPELDFHLEAKQFNSCLNRKVSVDTNGSIKNCPSLKQEYGQIKKKFLSRVIEQKDFQQIWKITKDQIEVCRDCEHRYICPDCRAHTINGSLGKPSSCLYDPYSATWNALAEEKIRKQIHVDCIYK